MYTNASVTFDPFVCLVTNKKKTLQIELLRLIYLFSSSVYWKTQLALSPWDESKTAVMAAHMVLTINHKYSDFCNENFIQKCLSKMFHAVS